ncbi:MAG TPA: helix-hairpin-helix domain-containing protein [Segetibacter sp.]|jgi:DNA uptake protein ComE-like DNA-binding protein
MKRWWQAVVKDYFTFSKRDRVGIAVLFAIGAFLYFFPKFIVVKRAPIDNSAFEKDIASLKIYADSSRPYKSYRSDDENFDYYEPKKYAFEKDAKGELFTFDPNTLDAAGWKRLGVRDRTIETIQKLVAKGFKFRKPEDIKRIYGLRPNEADRLLPFVTIAGNNTSSPSQPYDNTNPTYTSSSPSTRYVAKVIEINSADTSALISLPGIGSKLAMRIINFRDKLGGFASIDQVRETFGLPDSTFQKVKSRLQCNSSSVRKFNINTADINTLRTHPYIKWNIANAIFNYRQQHGNYKSLDDLKKIDIINNDVFNKIAPYLSI